ncbi:AI-2E family transporter [Leptolyngbya sp. FACHB-261]|uniref:AI-2E family transporter n=1 Tax=Leptolyngbya sp. FACHB-261 TaxID=2692806 RepID=UPI001685CB65|nr:AI-2E family transporter [Leptolyngbya sp. FACHB-261]MBD2101537.1 AI-2E family transporter [Leptolyngbya sp. FACHB-261]
MGERPIIKPWQQVSNRDLVRFLLLFACSWALLQILVYFNHVIVIFTVASITAFLLNYPVRWLKQLMPRGLAVALVFFTSLILITGLTVTLGLEVLSQGQQLIDSVSSFVNSLTPQVERLEGVLRVRRIPVNLRVIEEQIRNQVLAGIGFGLTFLQVILANLVDFILIAVVTFYMLLDGHRLWTLVLKALPPTLRNRFNRTVQLKFLGFFQGQLILCLFLTTCTMVAFLIMQVPFALILAVIVAVFDLIPGIGATLGVFLVFLILLLQNPWLAFRVLLLCIVLQQIQDNFIYPRVMGTSLNINPVVIFFALLVGARVAGLLGVFLAIPIAGVVVSMFEIDEMKGEA